MATITDDVRIAAEEAFSKAMGEQNHTLAGCLRAALEAVQPIIAKAECQRIRDDSTRTEFEHQGRRYEEYHVPAYLLDGGVLWLS